MVAECAVYCRRRIVKFFGGISIIYTGMSNKYNVKIIIAEYLRVISLRLSDEMKFDLYNLYVCSKFTRARHYFKSLMIGVFTCSDGLRYN